MCKSIKCLLSTKMQVQYPESMFRFAFFQSSVVSCTDNTSAEEVEVADSWDFPVLMFDLCSNKERLSEDQRMKLATT